MPSFVYLNIVDLSAVLAMVHRDLDEPSGGYQRTSE